MTEEFRSKVIRMAWEDRTTFEEIQEKVGLSEKEVIKVMRASLKPGSFRLWRKRVSGRKTKHRKLFKASVGKRFRWDEE
ncbi:MAG: TIGR03643 family protein [Akkermansiaceae bacterium]